MIHRIPPWCLAAVALAAVMFGLTLRTYSVDGAIMVGHTAVFADDESYGHLLLRPTAWTVTQLAGLCGWTSPDAKYHALRIVFTVMGIAGLTLLFEVARRRHGLAAAWAALACAALARSALRQMTTLDEKMVGIFWFCLAVWVTAGLFESQQRNQSVLWKGWLAAGLAWALAVLGHLQNGPFALVFMLSPFFFIPQSPPHLNRWRLIPLLAVWISGLGVCAFAALHYNYGGFAAIPEFLHKLGGGHPAPELQGAAAIAKGAFEGWLKCFFMVDRLSPHSMVLLALGGFAMVALVLADSLRRGFDPLLRVLLGGALFLMLLMPAVNSYPHFSDSYTMLAPAALLLLAGARRTLLAALAGLLALVNLPAQIDVSFPRLNMAQHLGRLEQIQHEEGRAPWVAVDELAGGNGQQIFCAIYYAMRPTLSYSSTTLERLPAGRLLMEIPHVIERGGRWDAERVGAVQAMLRERGRRSAARPMYAPPVIVRSDFLAYETYLVVEPAAASHE